MAVSIEQVHYRFRYDDGNESGATFLVGEDTPLLWQDKTIFRLRIQIRNSGSTSQLDVDPEFQCRLNGGSWQNITTSSSIVKAVSSPNVTNGGDCTRQLTVQGGYTYITNNNGMTTDGVSGGTVLDMTTLTYSETELVFQIVSTDVNDGDLIEFRLTRDGGVLLDVYSVTPAFTLAKYNLRKQLYSYYSLDESSGTRKDGNNHYSGGGADLTDHNTVAAAAGKLGQAGDFEFSNSEYLDTTAAHGVGSTGITAGQFTISCWVNLESSGVRVIASEQNTYQLYYDSGTSRFTFRLLAGPSSPLTSCVANAFGAPSLATWYHIFAWTDGSGWNGIRINDTAENMALRGGNPSATANLFVGANQTPAGFFDGLIDELAIWQRMLTSKEMTAIYNAGRGWKFPFYLERHGMGRGISRGILVG